MAALDFFQAGKLQESDHVAEEALKLNARSPDALHLRGVIAGLENRHVDAEFFLRKAAAYDESNHFINFNLAKALSEQGRDEESLKWHKKAIFLNENNGKAWLNYGRSLFKLRDIDSAIEAFDRALAIDKNVPETYTNKANCMREKRMFDEAISLFSRSIELDPDLSETWSNLSNVLCDLGRLNEALQSCERAIKLKPNYTEAWINRGNTLDELKRYDEALTSYEQAFGLNPDAEFLLGTLAHARMRFVDWRSLGNHLLALERKIINGEKASTPFAVLGLFDKPQLQQRCAEIYVESRVGCSNNLELIAKRSKGEKIRIGYFSMDFRAHPVSQLIIDLIEGHDRSRYRVYGFSFGANTNDPVRERLKKAFDSFVDVKHLSEVDIARLAREEAIDIAIDLGGHTKDSRPKIFYYRAAPIQINYLGYPGTFGSECMDYFIGDEVTITDGNRKYFSEKIIFLPNSFLPSQHRQLCKINKSPRQYYGLPENTFVFCCFNNTWKITPDILVSWCRILKTVKNSVLWITCSQVLAKENITKEFKQNNIDASRLIFAERLPKVSDHLNRYLNADLFLDTFPYGAHTTASDALWAGTPVLTMQGEAFASRVASSLLHAIGLPELITHNKGDYESLAIELAHTPKKLASIKAKLKENRTTCSLFNTALFAQHIEKAYTTAYDRHHAGLPPDHIYITR
jgi:protein O-GlcNAc transferase